MNNPKENNVVSKHIDPDTEFNKKEKEKKLILLDGFIRSSSIYEYFPISIKNIIYLYTQKCEMLIRKIRIPLKVSALDLKKAFTTILSEKCVAVANHNKITIVSINESGSTSYVQQINSKKRAKIRGIAFLGKKDPTLIIVSYNNVSKQNTFYYSGVSIKNNKFEKPKLLTLQRIDMSDYKGKEWQLESAEKYVVCIPKDHFVNFSLLLLGKRDGQIFCQKCIIPYLNKLKNFKSTICKFQRVIPLRRGYFVSYRDNVSSFHIFTYTSYRQKNTQYCSQLCKVNGQHNFIAGGLKIESYIMSFPPLELRQIKFFKGGKYHKIGFSLPKKQTLCDYPIISKGSPYADKWAFLFSVDDNKVTRNYIGIYEKIENSLTCIKKIDFPEKVEKVDKLIAFSFGIIICSAFTSLSPNMFLYIIKLA